MGTPITQKMPVLNLHLKYFDDVSLLESYQSKRILEERMMDRPLNFHQGTGQVICDDKLQMLQKFKM